MLKNDRYHETLYQAEKVLLSINKAGAYELEASMEPTCFQIGTNVEPEQTNELNKQNEQNKHTADKPPRKKFIPPTLKEVEAYIRERGSTVNAEKFFSYYDCSAWKDARGNPVKNWKQKLITWEGRQNADAKRSANNRGDHSKSTERDFGVRYDNDPD